MDAEFWKKAWLEGRTGFHERDFHPKLTKYFPQLSPSPGQCVLVPLCGKTKDLLWLHKLGLHVHGVELFEPAIQAFFSENQLAPIAKSQDPDFIHYTYKNMQLSCGDFFKLPPNASYDFVYDRAALVALPADMRKTYAQVIRRSLKKGGKYLLVVYEYDQSKLDGPPFSVSAEEIVQLYTDQFKIKFIESEVPNVEGSRLANLQTGIQQQVYMLEKFA